MIKIKKNGKLYDLVNTRIKIQNSLHNSNYGSVQGEDNLHPIFLPDFNKCISCIVPNISRETNEKLQIADQPYIKDLTNNGNNLNLINYSCTPEYNGLEYYPFSFLDEEFGFMNGSGSGLVEDYQITITSSIDTDACLVVSNKIGTVPAFDIEVSGVPEDCPLYFTNVVDGRFNQVKLSNGIYHIPESTDNGDGEYRCFNILHYANPNLNIVIKMLPKKANGIISRNLPIYRTDFTTWIIDNTDRGMDMYISNKYTVNITNIANNTSRIFSFIDESVQDPSDLPGFKVKITGLNGNSIDYLNINRDGSYSRTIFTQDGVYELPYSYQSKQNPSTYSQYITCFTGSQSTLGQCNISITQLPIDYDDTKDNYNTSFTLEYVTDFSDWRDANGNETSKYVEKSGEHALQIKGGEGNLTYYLCDESKIIPSYYIYALNINHQNVTLRYRYQKQDHSYASVQIYNGINYLPESYMYKLSDDENWFTGFYIEDGTGMLDTPIVLYIIPINNVGYLTHWQDMNINSILTILDNIRTVNGSYIYNTVIDGDRVTDRLFFWRDGNGVLQIGEGTGETITDLQENITDVSLVRTSDTGTNSFFYLNNMNPNNSLMPSSTNIKALVQYSTQLTTEQVQKIFQILHQYIDSE